MPSTTISINITTPTALSIAQLTDTLCTYWGYQATLADGTANPQTKAAFVKARVALFLKDSYVAAKANVDAEAARQTAITTAGQITAD